MSPENLQGQILLCQYVQCISNLSNLYLRLEKKSAGVIKIIKISKSSSIHVPIALSTTPRTFSSPIIVFGVEKIVDDSTFFANRWTFNSCLTWFLTLFMLWLNTRGRTTWIQFVNPTYVAAHLLYNWTAPSWFLLGLKMYAWGGKSHQNFKCILYTCIDCFIEYWPTSTLTFFSPILE